MKKLLLLLLIVLISSSLISCDNNIENEPLNLTDSQIIDISKPLIEESLKIYSKVIGLYLEKGDSITENGLTYYKLDIKNKSELWKTVTDVHTEEASKRIFASSIEGDDVYTAKFIEKEGTLYASRVIPSVGLDCYPLKSVKIIEQKENYFSVLADFYYTYSILDFKYTESGWRIDNSVMEGEKRFAQTLEQQKINDALTIINDELVLHTEKLTMCDLLSFDEAKSIFLPLFERSFIVYHNYIMNAPQFNMGNITPDFKVKNTEYHFVEFSELKTLDDIWHNAFGAFTNECAIRLFSESLEQTNPEARYIERDNKLYYCPYGHGNNVEYDMSSLQLVAQYKDLLVFTIDYMFDEGKAVFVLQNTSAGWRMANGFDEQVFLPDSYLEHNDIKQLTFDLPEDFVDMPYSEPEFVEIEDFEWGDYLPLVTYAKDELDDPTPIYSLLGEGVNTLDDGHRAYEKLNSLYLTQYPIPDEGYYYETIPLNKESVSDYLFGSNIVNATKDLSKLQVWRVVDWGKDSVHGELDTYENGKLVKTETSNSWYYRVDTDSIMSSLNGITVKRNWSHKDPKNHIFDVYNGENQSYKVCFELDDSYTVILDQIIDSTKLLFTFIHFGWLEDDYVHNNENNDNGINRNTYLLDLESERLTKIENYLAYPLLSPDGEYLIYSSFRDRNASANPPDNYSYIMKEGFYIKQLSTGKTIFYPLVTLWEPVHNTICWISKKAYNNAIDG